jgi:hypothetical protein
LKNLVTSDKTKDLMKIDQILSDKKSEKGSRIDDNEKREELEIEEEDKADLKELISII